MPVWTDHTTNRPGASFAKRIVGFLMGICMALSAYAALAEEEPIGPMVMSNFRHGTFPAPEIPASARAEDAYFEGMVLVGDSVAEGLSLHKLIPRMEILTRIGLSPRTALSDKVFEHEGQPATLVEKLSGMRPRAIYLWLGSNGVDVKDEARVIGDYDRLLNGLLSALPDTPVFLMELTPVGRAAQERYIKYTNGRVDAFNALLADVARRHNVYLLTVNFLLKNGEGLLDSAYGAGDGIHLRKPGYEMLADYIYTHTLPLEHPAAGEDGA